MVNTIFILDKTYSTTQILVGDKSSQRMFWNDLYVQEFDTGAETFEFSCYLNEDVVEGNYVAFYYNNQYKLFTIMEMEQTHKNGRLVANCYCEVASLSLLNNYVREFSGDMNCIQFFEYILQGTDWHIGKYSTSLKDRVETIKVNKIESVWSLIEDYKDIYECELNVRVTYENGRITGQYIDLYADGGLGSPTYKRFEYGKNVTGIVKKKELYDWCTAIILDVECDVSDTIIKESDGYGFTKGAGDVILNDNANRMYNCGKNHVVGVYEGDEEEPVEACINAWKELEKRSVPRFDYEVTTALTDEEYDKIFLGDTVHVIDYSYTPPLFLEARVGKLELSFTDKTQNKCVLTNYKEIKSKLLDVDYIKLTGTITDVVNAFFPITSEGIADGAITEGKIETTYFQQITADIVSAGIGAFEDLYTQNLTVINADIEKLKAMEADISILQAGKADIIDLNAIKASINTLEADYAKIDTLVNGHLTSDNIQSMIITGDKFTVADAFIKDAMIDTVNASKINAGIINTNNVQIQSSDGSMLLNGSTQQFKDKDGKVRIQIGKDAQGEFTFALFSQDGQGVLIDETGIKEGAIGDGLIVDDMVADNANIAGSKLDIHSVITSINNSSTTIKSSKIYLDEEGQSLQVAFDALKTKVDTIEEVTISGDLSSVIEQVTSNTTKINVMQGEIGSLISNTTITRANGEVVQLKDEYNSTKTTVDGHTTKLGSLETNVNNVTSKQATLESNLEGFKTTVSETYSTKSDLSNLQIGGTNLLYGTDVTKSVNVNITNVDQTYWVWDPYTTYNRTAISQLGLTVNDYITVSFDWEITSATQYGHFRAEAQNPTGGHICALGNTIYLSSTNTKGRYVSSMKMTEALLDMAVLRLRIDNSILTMTIKNAKLEKGNKATAWSPSPQDVNQQFQVVNNKYSSLESDLSGFKTTVGTTYTTKTDFNALQVGGRNLYLNTQDFTDNNIWKNGTHWVIQDETYNGTVIRKSTKAWAGIHQETKIEEGKTYTLSAWIKGEAGGQINGYADTGQDIISRNFTQGEDISTTWRRYSFVFKANSLATYPHNRARFENRVDGKATYICGMKLEEGNKSTDWTPAPEDTQGKIEVVDNKYTALQADLSGFKATVSSTYSTKSELSSVQSTANTAKSTADSALGKANTNATNITTISNKYTTLEGDLNGFKGTVASTYTTKQAFNDLQIGGTNLLFGTETAKALTVNAVGDGNFQTFDPYTTYNTQSLSQLGLTTNDYVTISFDWSISNATTYGNFRVEGVNSSGSYIGTLFDSAVPLASNKTSGRYIFTRKLPSELLPMAKLRIRIDNSALTMTIKNVMLEKGQKATAWSPSPYDVKQQITTVSDKYTSLEADVGKFKTTVGDTYTTKTEFNNLKFGGTNLLQNSDCSQGTTHWYGSNSSKLEVVEKSACPVTPPAELGKLFRSAVTAGNNVARVCQTRTMLRTNTTYTVSAWIFGNSIKPEIAIYAIDGSSWNWVAEVVKDTTGFWHKASLTFKTRADAPSGGYAITFGIKGAVEGREIYCGQPMLEEGSRATSWSPAPKDTSAVYTTKSEFQQTSQDFTFKIKQSGGNNLLRNSAFKNGTAHWTIWQSGSASLNSKSWGTMAPWSDYNKQPDYALRVQGNVTASGVESRAGCHSHTIDVKANTTYSFACWIGCHRANAIRLEIYDNRDGNLAYRGDRAVEKAVSAPGSSTTNYNAWTRLEYTFTTPANTTQVQVRFLMTKHTGDSQLTTIMFLALPVLVEGSVPPSVWVPHASELYDGIVTIDRDGLTVKQGSSKTNLNSTSLDFYSGSNRYSRVKDGAFSFTDTSGNNVGVMGRNTWVDTTRYISHMGAYYGHDVALGRMTSSSATTFSAPLIVTAGTHQLPSGGVNYDGLNMNYPVVSSVMRFAPTSKDWLDWYNNGYAGWGEVYASGTSDDQHLYVVAKDRLNLALRGRTLLYFEAGAGGVSSDSWMNIACEVNCGGWGFYNFKTATLTSAQSSYTQSLLDSGTNEHIMHGGLNYDSGEIRWTWKETVFTYAEADVDPVTDEWVYTGRNICYIELPIFMAENIRNDYHVNISKMSWGDYRIIEKTPYYFILESEKEDFAFTFEVVARFIDSADLDHNASVAGSQYLVDNRPDVSEEVQIPFDFENHKFVAEEVEDDIQDNIIIGED